MSVLTSTNEESLINLLDKCPDGHFVLIIPAGELLMDVYVLPEADHDKFMYMNKEERKQFWKCGWGGLGIHKDVWKKGPDAAQAYRYR